MPLRTLTIALLFDLRVEQLHKLINPCLVSFPRKRSDKAREING